MNTEDNLDDVFRDGYARVDPIWATRREAMLRAIREDMRLRRYRDMHHLALCRALDAERKTAFVFKGVPVETVTP